MKELPTDEEIEMLLEKYKDDPTIRFIRLTHQRRICTRCGITLLRAASRQHKRWHDKWEPV